ncbi:MAG: C39 family peptidase [Candidatus Bathyarchaeia archaeon]
MTELNVPLWGQPTRNYCVPTCLKMLLEFLRQKYGDAIPKLSISQIARIVNTQWDGTAPEDVENINKYFEAKLCIYFKAEYMRRFPEIQKELDEERPVITWVNSQKPPDKLWHAIVVRGFDESHFVIFNDPWDCKRKTEEVGVFISKWGTEAKMVKLLISKEKQSSLYEYQNAHQINGELIHE